MRKLGLFALLLFSLTGEAHAQSTPTAAGTTNFSATIATGNTFQTVLVAVLNAYGRKSLSIQNNNATDSCWITFGTLSNGTKITAASAVKASSILLLAGGSYTRYYPYIPADEIEATCATAGDSLYVDTQ